MPGRWGLATVRGSVLCPVDSKSLVYLGCEVRSLALVFSGRGVVVLLSAIEANAIVSVQFSVQFTP